MEGVERVGQLADTNRPVGSARLSQSAPSRRRTPWCRSSPRAPCGRCRL